MKRRDFLGSIAAAAAAAAVPKAAMSATFGPSYRQVIQDTAAMVGDRAAQALVQKHGLQILNVTWEDTGRYKNSAVGPNISDMTIQVQHKNPSTGKNELTLMPVIRFPNFEDKTADISADQFHLLVGNETGENLRKVTLTDVLANLRGYLHNPDSWGGREDSLLARRRDDKVLVSAQACFLPVPKEGIATFNPVLFNYQSYEGDPAVLTILASREGTSITIIDNKRDGFEAGWSWGQRLFFNKNGERASFTGQRMSDFEASPEFHNPHVKGSASAAGQEGLNMVLMIQVPLKQKSPMRYDDEDMYLESASMAPMEDRKSRDSDVEAAVIGHGDVEGPFTEIDGVAIERDTRFPVRVTVQFYQATSNGVVSEADVEKIASQLRRVYDEGDYVGSLVTEGETGRPTEYDGNKNQPPDWWQKFWQRFHTDMKLPL